MIRWNSFLWLPQIQPNRDLMELQRSAPADKETDMTSESEEIVKKRADASFRKEERAKDGQKGAAEYEAASRAVVAKTARLRALRLAKEAAEKTQEVTTVARKPTRQKRPIPPIP
jgi:hypothetical protein